MPRRDNRRGLKGCPIVAVAAVVAALAMPADVMHSVFADRFRTWHGVASIAYLIESLLGLVLVLKAR